YTNQPAIPPSYDPKQLGPNFAPFYVNQFPNIIGIIDSTIAPVVGGTSLPLGQGFAVEWLKDVKPTANISLTWVKGNHTYKAGGELIVEGFPQRSAARANGGFNWSNNQTSNPWEIGNASFPFQTGFAYASFLLGMVDNLNYSALTDSRLGNHTIGLFVQDTWKVTRKFTLDYG